MHGSCSVNVTFLTVCIAPVELFEVGELARVEAATARGGIDSIAAGPLEGNLFEERIAGAGVGFDGEVLDQGFELASGVARWKIRRSVSAKNPATLAAP